MTFAGLVLVVGLLGADPQPAGAPAAPASQPSREQVEASIRRGVEFLLQDQNANGSWGSKRNSTIFDWGNIETHRSWTAATTGLCVMALLSVEPNTGVDKAIERGIDYLLLNANVRRPGDWDTDNTWAYVYGLEGLVHAYAAGRFKDPAREAKAREVINALLDKLAAYQTPSGGWGYYDFEGPMRRPSWATTFMTAAAAITLREAIEADFTPKARVLPAALRAILHSRLPSGAYCYTVEAVPDPRSATWIDQVKGSLSRIVTCDLALRLNHAVGTPPDPTKGLDLFFRYHRFLDIARKRPLPHEAYYYNSGYFYMFGHYYAARAIRLLPAAQQAVYWPKLRREVMKCQGPDGSVWDFYMAGYTKPYGTAYAVMALQASLTPPASNKATSKPAGE